MTEENTNGEAPEHNHDGEAHDHNNAGENAPEAAPESAPDKEVKISSIRKWFLNKDGLQILEDNKGKPAEEIQKALKEAGTWKTMHKGKLAAVVAVPAAIGYMLTRKRKEPNLPEASYVDQISQQRDAEALAASQYGEQDPYASMADRESLGQWTDRANAEQAAESADVYRA